MRSKRTKPDELPTIWRVPEDLWRKIKPLLDEYDPPKRTGRKCIDARAALDAIIFRLRSGSQWNQLPSEFPDDSSVHRTFQRWIRLGLFDHLWVTLLTDCAELGGVNCEWQAADAAMSKARLGDAVVRFDEKASNYLALIKLACMLIWYRRYVRLSVLR